VKDTEFPGGRIEANQRAITPPMTFAHRRCQRSGQEIISLDLVFELISPFVLETMLVKMKEPFPYLKALRSKRRHKLN